MKVVWSILRNMESANYDKITERIFHLMKVKGYNKKSFAEHLEVNRATFYHLASKRNEPTLSIIIAIANKFPGVNIEWLIKGTEAMESKPNKIEYPHLRVG